MFHQKPYFNAIYEYTISYRTRPERNSLMQLFTVSTWIRGLLREEFSRRGACGNSSVVSDNVLVKKCAS